MNKYVISMLSKKGYNVIDLRQARFPNCWEASFPTVGKDASQQLGSILPNSWEASFPTVGKPPFRQSESLLHDSREAGWVFLKCRKLKHTVNKVSSLRDLSCAAKKSRRDEISVENKTVAIKNPVGMTCRSNPALYLNCWKSPDTDMSSLRDSVEAGTCFLPTCHPYGISDSHVRRLLSEPLISVPEPDSGFMINMTGLYSKSRRDDTLLNVFSSLRQGYPQLSLII
ncbi:MAG: hypothetical protein LBQ01_03620 [Prevotellaceae bacterium]|jgi:hypothetical protein|nr:hypothetical protein [Prevotellaceae bacterium]